MKRKEAKDQQNFYRDILNSQVNIKQAIKEEQKYLSPLEKALAKEYTNANPEEIAMLPG